jgi:hypothetical protein
VLDQLMAFQLDSNKRLMGWKRRQKSKTRIGCSEIRDIAATMADVAFETNDAVGASNTPKPEQLEVGSTV